MLKKDSTFSLVQEGAVIAVAGQVDFNNAPQLCKQGEQLIAASKDSNLKIDFSGLTSANSVLLAVLCAWLRSANLGNINLKFSGFDKRMRDLFKLCGFSALYPDYTGE